MGKITRVVSLLAYWNFIPHYVRGIWNGRRFDYYPCDRYGRLLQERQP